MRKCCICGKQLTGMGNNPFPVKTSGRCCDNCNIKFVIPERIKQMVKDVSDNKEKEEVKDEDQGDM